MATIPSVPAPTKAQWLALVNPMLPVLQKGDVASASAMQQLLVDAVAIVNTAP